MKLAIFDIDGTLVNTNEIDTICFLDAFTQEFGISDVNSNWSEYSAVTDSAISQQIFQTKLQRNPSKNELLRLENRFVDLLAKAEQKNQGLFTPISGALVMFDRLKLDSNWRIAIATGGWYTSALFKLKTATFDIGNIPLASANDGLTRDDIVNLSILKAKQEYNIENFSKIVSIGDGIWDVKTAAKLDLGFVGISQVQTQKKLFQAGAKDVLTNFEQVSNFQQILEQAVVPSIF
ncbi:MAG: HAD hydrolase-like protein [Xenococcaceae cyanobacterium MO_188.B29]|nr:HAD hydrolase-like protein [Xenococcaceae cyanobacterium MO_188.B29]